MSGEIKKEKEKIVFKPLLEYRSFSIVAQRYVIYLINLYVFFFIQESSLPYKVDKIVLIREQTEKLTATRWNQYEN